MLCECVWLFLNFKGFSYPCPLYRCHNQTILHIYEKSVFRRWGGVANHFKEAYIGPQHEKIRFYKVERYLKDEGGIYEMILFLTNGFLN